MAEGGSAMCLRKLTLAKHCFRFYRRSKKGNMAKPKGPKNALKPSCGIGAKPVIQKASNAAMLLAKCLKNGAEPVANEVGGAGACVTPGNPKTANEGKNWDKDLAALGYSALTCQIPNKAVQAILCCFGDSNVHEYIICKEMEISDSRYSAVAYLGFNQWLAVLAGYMKEPDVIFNELDLVYHGMQELLFSRTEKEDFFSAMAEKVNVGLEGANNINKKTASSIIAPKKSIATPKMGNSIFKSSLLGRHGTNNNNAVANAEPAMKHEAVRLNMVNSSLFPALTHDVVEALARQYDHAMWRCKNLGVIAPINEESWKYLADIDDEQVKTVKAIMEAGDHILDKNIVELPFGTRIFEKDCNCPFGVYVNQKNHMANTNTKRDDYYVRRMWRSFCPYIKCACDKRKYRKDDMIACKDNITWVDHAVWYLLNNLDVVFPSMSTKEAFLHMVGLLSTVMQPAVLAIIGYMHFREKMVDAAIEWALDKESNLQQKLGNNKMIQIAEAMIKPDPNENSASTKSNSGFMLSARKGYDADMEMNNTFFPPRLVRMQPDGSTGAGTSVDSVLNTVNIGECSVNKGTGRFEKDIVPRKLDL